jgi:hypothetical protein
MQLTQKPIVKMINKIYHIMEYKLSKDKEYLELIPGGSLQICKIISTTKTHMAKDKN